MTLIGKKLYFFIPDLKAEEPTFFTDYVIAEEFDVTDRTVKVRFLSGKAVQKFAVGETKEEVAEAFKKFQEYKKVYWECFDEMTPIEKKLKAKYEEMYGEYMDIPLGDEIERRHNGDLVVADAEAKEAEAKAEAKAEEDPGVCTGE